MKKTLLLSGLLSLAFLSCSGTDDSSPIVPPANPATEIVSYRYLALGDSYTIGQSVCETCRFPEQLKTRLQAEIPNSAISIDIIATTGWTTTNLISAINSQNPGSNYDLVTLLIGVNNQFQHKPFSVYEQEFPQLVDKAVAFAQGEKSKVIVVSIPDYAFTPFGQNTSNAAQVSSEIDQYNAFAQDYCIENNIAFINITDITRLGIQNPALVATDGLHPSQPAYSQFVDRILPKAKTAILE